MLFAGGAGGNQFKGTLDNTRVFGKLRRPSACIKGPAPRQHLSVERETMMKYLLSLWLLGAPLLPPPGRRGSDLAARIRYVDGVTGSDASPESQWQEKWRGSVTGGASGSFRSPARAYHATHDARPGQNTSPDGGVGSPAARETHSSCATPMPGTTSWWRCRREEYGQVAFKPEWARIRHLINPSCWKLK